MRKMLTVLLLASCGGGGSEDDSVYGDYSCNCLIECKGSAYCAQAEADVFICAQRTHVGGILDEPGRLEYASSYLPNIIYKDGTVAGCDVLPHSKVSCTCQETNIVVCGGKAKDDPLYPAFCLEYR